MFAVAVPGAVAAGFQRRRLALAAVAAARHRSAAAVRRAVPRAAGALPEGLCPPAPRLASLPRSSQLSPRARL